MMEKRKFLLIIALILFAAAPLAAQNAKQDVLYLKNGSMIRGTIVQFVPDSTVKIQTADGSLFVFRSTEVDKILKEDAPVPAGTSSALPQKQKEVNTNVSVFGGVAIPGSQFADFASTGFTLGVQVHSKNNVGVLFNISYTSNPTPFDVNWTSFIILLGLKASLKKTETSDVYIAPFFGLHVLRLEGFSESAAAYGGMIGVQLNQRVGLGLRIVASEPGDAGGSLSTSIVHVFVALTL